MDIAKAITFITEDPRWKEKMGMGLIVVLASTILSILLVGILGFAIVAGYSIRLLQNVRDGEPHPLPEWDQWGDDMKRGLKFIVVGIVWALPMILVSIMFAILGLLLDATGGGDGPEVIAGIMASLGGCLYFLYTIFLMGMTPGFTLAFAQNEKISDGLQFTPILHWTRNNLAEVVVAALITLIAPMLISLVAFIAGIIMCGVGLIVTIPLATLVQSLFQHHIYGQLGAKTQPQI